MSAAELACQGLAELVPCSTEAALEKHVPVLAEAGGVCTVKVGSVAHPMTEPHFIGWVLLETSLGWHKADLDPLGKPEAAFALQPGEKVVAAYAWCNLHGLWKAAA
ncbi:MAG: desulfoferrodoxin [Duodenibacillus sp.]|nr:desulfoferrodoxin [Duodenibacillus sp.]